MGVVSGYCMMRGSVGGEGGLVVGLWGGGVVSICDVSVCC